MLTLPKPLMREKEPDTLGYGRGVKEGETYGRGRQVTPVMQELVEWERYRVVES